MPKVIGIIQRAKKTIGKSVGRPKLSKSEIAILTKEQKRHPESKTIFLDIGRNDLRRTIYTLFKFFDLAKVNLEVISNRMLFAEMKSDQYGKWAIEDSLFRIAKKKPKDSLLFAFNNKSDGLEISDDYFHEDPNAYYLPITQHPIMYRKGFWNEEVNTAMESRINIPFFAGSFGYNTYKRLKSNDTFRVNNRNDLITFLTEKCTIKWVENENDIGKNVSADLIISDTSSFHIPSSQLRHTLSKYTFFFAFPGASVPHCHNLAEALSVGCIPIIQSGYADLLYPKMEDGLNALIYKSLEEIPSILEKAYTMPHSLIKVMNNEVSQYYNSYYTPNAVVKNILDPSTKSARLISFSNSVKYLH